MDIAIACLCPPDGARHPEGDTVVLRDRLEFRSVTTIRTAVRIMREEGITDPAEILATMTEWYLLLGIESWTLVDAKGKPEPVTRDAIRTRLLANDDAADDVVGLADAADDLYQSRVLLPLMNRVSRSSQTTPTAPSTSPRTASSGSHPTRSKRSSTTSSQTAATATTTTSPAGGSSTSPSSESAA